MSSFSPDSDMKTYMSAVNYLITSGPVSGSRGTYHVKNGTIHLGYDTIPVRGFSSSSHLWEIMH